ncbi:MAG: hypothetical protein LBS59_02325 [Puniceicoccales bacterium]|nr:hypothetical protein [Puniceicoccales bacterium]
MRNIFLRHRGQVLPIAFLRGTGARSCSRLFATTAANAFFIRNHDHETLLHHDCH